MDSKAGERNILRFSNEAIL